MILDKIFGFQDPLSGLFGGGGHRGGNKSNVTINNNYGVQGNGNNIQGTGAQGAQGCCQGGGQGQQGNELVPVMVPRQIAGALQNAFGGALGA